MKFALALALLGSIAPDLELVDSTGRRTTLGQLAKTGPVAIALANTCADVQPASAPEGVRRFVVTPMPCTGTLQDPAGALAKLLGRSRVALVDSGRVVRLVSDNPAAFNRQVADWKRGADIYTTQCLRCHGAEGTDTHYSGIKPLHGIGNRLGEAEIIERTVRSGSVDLSRFDADERRALATYVAGL